MRYDFTDTNAAPVVSAELPAEAVRFNGKWLDSEVPGFRTLSVIGRETFGRTITDESYISPACHGRRYLNAVQEPRTITVRFMLDADTPEAFRERINTLHALLVPTQKQLMFNDEPGKYYIATLNDMPEFPEGTNHVTGEIAFYCADPSKFAIDYQAVTIAGNQSVTANTDDLTPCVITVTANSNLNQLTLYGLSRNKHTGTEYPIIIKNLIQDIPVIIDGETGRALQSGQSKFIDNELELQTFPTLKPGSNSIRISKSSDVVSVAVEIKYRPINV